MQENYRRFTVELHSYTNEELVGLFQNTQKEEYLKELMAKNSGIIVTIAKSYCIPSYDIEDLVEVGYIALWEAVKCYDKERGFAFITCLKGFVKQNFNRLYNKAYAKKRSNGSEPVSWEELTEINKEGSMYDDYSSILMEELLDALKGTTKSVARFLLGGYTKSEVADALGITSASVIYHIKKIQKAYIEYMEAV